MEPNLLRAARRHFPSSDTSQDVVQDVAVLAIRNAHRFKDSGEFQKWAYARLRWLVLDQLQASASAQRGKPKALDEISEPWVLPTQLNATIISELISKLPLRQRIVLQKTVEGASDKEIAASLNINDATVRSLRRFARKRMSDFLEGSKTGK